MGNSSQLGDSPSCSKVVCEIVYGNAKVSDWAQISGNAKIFGNAKVFDWARVRDNVKIFGFAEVFFHALIVDNVELNGWKKVYGNTFMSDKKRHKKCVLVFLPKQA